MSYIRIDIDEKSKILDHRKMMRYDQPWMIVQDKVQILHKSPASIWCDRRQHLLILYYEANKYASLSSINSTINMSDHSNIPNGRTSDLQTVSKWNSFDEMFKRKSFC